MQVCVVCACICIGHTCAHIINTVHITDLFQDFFIYNILPQRLGEEGQKKKKNTTNNLTKTYVLQLRTHGLRIFKTSPTKEECEKRVGRGLLVTG